ncbi:MAG: ATP-binding protein [Lachnospiraceae bacterium]|nr:ATP-binding protein [Lachnospiraceae bacterium]
MGTYLNPGNSGFEEILKSEYIDKTGLIGLINRTIGSKKKLTCISRPRRFGKSYAAQMLCAYYDRSCDSDSLFDGFVIKMDDSYKSHLNKYHVINLDISGFISMAKQEKKPLSDIPSVINRSIMDEVISEYPLIKSVGRLNDCLLELVRKTKTKIVFIIDEWDSLIREAKDDDETQEAYLNLLRGWFKNNNFTPEAVAAAYMTGILPIKKDGSQSAISDFQEYSMLEPLDFAEYVGFTEKEVFDICEEHNVSFESMKKWYDGYTVGYRKSIYNPYSVIQAIGTGKYKSYWKKTSAAETLMTYIDMNQDGLQDDVARLIAGECIVVDTDSFQNDVENFTSKDDVLTLLIHLGYLSYEEVSDSYGGNDDETLTGLAKIPNEEVRSEFEKILRKSKHKSLIELVRKSDELLKETIACNGELVAKRIQEVHESEYAPTYYNNEQSLRYVVKMAYISCVDQYGKIEELPSGHGIADLIFIPKIRSALPAMIVELKWDKSSEGAVTQIKDKNYPKVLEQFFGEILLVGINYDEANKRHSCHIEKLVKK